MNAKMISRDGKAISFKEEGVRSTEDLTGYEA
jgi:hypothetical protein